MKRFRAMQPNARSGIAGLLIGSSAENVLGSLQASILAVKPVGFRTPVSL